MIKQHLTFAVGLTQIVLLLSIAAYREKVSLGCRIPHSHLKGEVSWGFWYLLLKMTKY